MGDILKRKIIMKSGRCCLIALVVIASIVLFGILGVFTAFQFMGYPYHASCEIKWEFSRNCGGVRQAITNQINAWEKDTCPNEESSCQERGLPPRCTPCTSMPCGQRCLYNHTRSEDGKVYANHLTPVAKYRDDMTFEFENVGTNKCKVEAFSTSSVWYAILDFGTNYCNSRNLVDGAGLSRENGFNETTSTSICTQYDQINCERY